MPCETGRHDAGKGWHLFGLGNECRVSAESGLLMLRSHNAHPWIWIPVHHERRFFQSRRSKSRCDHIKILKKLWHAKLPARLIRRRTRTANLTRYTKIRPETRSRPIARAMCSWSASIVTQVHCNGRGGPSKLHCTQNMQLAICTLLMLFMPASLACPEDPAGLVHEHGARTQRTTESGQPGASRYGIGGKCAHTCARELPVSLRDLAQFGNRLVPVSLSIGMEMDKSPVRSASDVTGAETNMIAHRNISARSVSDVTALTHNLIQGAYLHNAARSASDAAAFPHTHRETTRPRTAARSASDVSASSHTYPTHTYPVSTVARSVSNMASSPHTVTPLSHLHTTARSASDVSGSPHTVTPPSNLHTTARSVSDVASSPHTVTPQSNLHTITRSVSDVDAMHPPIHPPAMRTPRMGKRPRSVLSKLFSGLSALLLINSRLGTRAQTHSAAMLLLSVPLAAASSGEASASANRTVASGRLPNETDARQQEHTETETWVHEHNKTSTWKQGDPETSALWWFGGDGDWADENAWHGEQPKAAMRVDVCTPGAVVSVTTTEYSDATELHVCDMDGQTLLIYDYLCLGPDCGALPPPPVMPDAWWQGVDGDWADDQTWGGSQPEWANRVDVCTPGAIVSVTTPEYSDALELHVCDKDGQALSIYDYLCLGPQCGALPDCTRQCPLGTYLTGCTDQSPGECTPCSNSNLTCADGFYRSLGCDGPDGFQCTSCYAPERDCWPGTFRVGCGPGPDKGKCEPCHDDFACPQGFYFIGCFQPPSPPAIAPQAPPFVPLWAPQTPPPPLVCRRMLGIV